MSEHKKYTSIKLNASVYNTYKTRPNTIPHALGEFIDNAIGSYQQNKERLIENEQQKLPFVTMLQAFLSMRIGQLSNLLTNLMMTKA